MPVTPRVNSVEEVSRGVIRGIPLTWSQQRRRYVRAARSAGSLGAFIPMQGYFFFSPQDATLIVGGRPPESTVHTFENGWNVIGPAQTGWYDLGQFVLNGWYLDPERRRFVPIPKDDQGRVFLETTRAYRIMLRHPQRKLEVDLAAPDAR